MQLSSSGEEGDEEMGEGEEGGVRGLCEWGGGGWRRLDVDDGWLDATPVEKGLLTLVLVWYSEMYWYVQYINIVTGGIIKKIFMLY